MSTPPATPRHPAAPWLLVSLRDTAEAVAAIAGGAQLLDVKDPSRGPLGFAGASTISDIARLAADANLPLSAALGEAVEWLDREVPAMPPGIRYGKLGLSQLGKRADWRERWMDVRSRFEQSGCRGIRWIAVAYADWQQAGAPPPGGVVAAAVETGCAGVLFDTWSKSSGPLARHVAGDQLAAWTEAIRAGGLIVALAGRLGPDDLWRIKALSPDVIAVRSAACRHQNRLGPIDCNAVAALRRAIEETFGGPNEPTVPPAGGTRRDALPPSDSL